MPEGHAAPRRVDLIPEAHAPNAERWVTQQASARRVESALRSALFEASDDDDWMRRYLHEWGAQVGRLDLSEVPVNVRGNSPRLDERLGDTALAFYDGIPITEPIKRPPSQVSNFRPATLRDLLYDWAIEQIEWWLSNYHAEMERFSTFKWPDWCTEQTERDEYIKSVRQFTTVLALGQSAFRPRAKNLIWDVRDLGNIRLLDFGAPLQTHFDVAFLHDFLDGCRDRDMVSQVTTTGATFNANVALQIYMAPHLTTLAPGYEMVPKELKRLAAAGYVEFVSFLGFLPCRFIQQGTRARKLEPERPRRISDAGTPRIDMVDSDGVPVVPLNVAIRLIPHEERPDDETYQYGNDTENTTGVLGSDGLLPPSKSLRRRQRLPWEAKPHVQDAMHDTMVLLYMANTFGLDLYVITDDWKDMFNQFRIAP